MVEPYEASLTMNTSLGMLTSLGAQYLEFSATPSEPGPLCSTCGERDYAVVRCCENGHAASWTWLFSVAETHVAFCRSRLQRDLNVPCVAEGCTGKIPPDVKQFVLRHCPVAKTFDDEMQAEMNRLMKGGLKVVGAREVPGPERTVCRRICAKEPWKETRTTRRKVFLDWNKTKLRRKERRTR